MLLKHTAIYSSLKKQNRKIMKNNNDPIADQKIKENNLPMVPWKRIRQAIRKYVEKDMPGKVSDTDVLAKIEHLKFLASVSGSYSIGRKKISALAKALLNQEVKIVCPICLDWRDIDAPEVVPELVRKHELFLEKAFAQLEKIPVILLIPTYEYENKSAAVLTLIQTIREHVSDRGWLVMSMLEVFPDILMKERECVDKIRASDFFADGRIERLAEQRRDLYAQRAPAISFEKSVSLTLRTSAQYMAFGESVHARGWIICNHTTANLFWYGKTNVALLHNPVYLY